MRRLLLLLAALFVLAAPSLLLRPHLVSAQYAPVVWPNSFGTAPGQIGMDVP